MSKPLQKDTFPADYNSLKNRLATHERSDMLDSYLLEINTTGLSNEQIDKIVVGGGFGGPGGQVNIGNGIMISDPTNKLLLVRQEGAWRKVSVV